MENNNEVKKLNIWLKWIFWSIVAVFLMFYITCNKTTNKKIKVGEYEIELSQINELKGKVKEDAEDFKNQIAALRNLNTDSVNLVLKDSIVELNAIRQKDLNQAESLLSEFERINTYSKEELEVFIQKVFNYLSRAKNPNRYLDFRMVVNSLFKTDTIQALTRKEYEKDSIIKRLYTTLKELNIKYLTALDKISETKNIIDSLKNGSVRSENLIKLLESNVESLRKSNDDLIKLMNSYSPIRVENCSFTVPGVKSQKDKSFLVTKIKSIELQFTIYSNTPTNDSTRTVKVVFTLPLLSKNNNETKESVIIKNVKIGVPNIFTFDDPSYLYIAGAYSAQIFHKETSEVIPIERKYITVKRRFK